MPDLALEGCRPQPLMSYLKALGVFRLVAEQADFAARLWWDRAGHAVLRSLLDAEGLERFLLDEYRPAPITSPWNAGSGYYREPAHREAVAVLDRVANSTEPRPRGCAPRRIRAATPQLGRPRLVVDPVLGSCGLLSSFGLSRASGVVSPVALARAIGSEG